MSTPESSLANARAMDAAGVSRILVRGVNWLGDAVMTTPALRRLRERFPSAHVTLLMPQKLGDLFVGHPDLDAVATFAPGESPWRIGRRLRSGNFDLGLVLPNSPRSALEVLFSGARLRVGYARSWRSLFLTEAIPARPDERPMRKRTVAEVRRLLTNSSPDSAGIPPKSHHIFQYLHLVEALGGSAAPLEPRLHVSAAEMTAARERLGSDATTWIGLNAGAEYGPAKRWPKERFIAVARRLVELPGIGLVLFGGKSDSPVTNEIEAAVKQTRPEAVVVNTAGRTTLRELGALMAACRVVVTNDTGPMHVAAAVGATLVVPFGSTSPEMTGPGLPGDGKHLFLRSAVPCSPCFLRECPIDFRCMNGIGDQTVFQGVVKVLGLDSP